MPEGKRPKWRHSCRWEYRIKIDLREIGWGGMEWIYLDKDKGQWGSSEHGNEPSGSITFCKFLRMIE
jgi:hypothetical protein